MFHADPPTRRAALVLLLVCLVVAGPAAATPAAPDSDSSKAGTTVVLVTASGDATVDQTASTAYVWANRTVDIEVTYNVTGPTNNTRVCLFPVSDNGPGTCKPASQSDGYSYLTFTDIPVGNEERAYEVSIVRENTSTNATENVTTGTLDTSTLNVTGIAESGDLDGDSLKNSDEARLHTFVYDTDSDNDGLQDGPEVHEYSTNPLTADGDGDGLRDAVEINRGTDPEISDTDADGLTDAREANKANTDPTAADTDGDGLKDGKEVKSGSDPKAVDTDSDGFGDHLETQFNTGPASVWSPLGVVGLLFLGAIVVAGHRYGDWDLPRSQPVDDGPDRPSDPTPRPSPPRTDREEVLALLESNGGKLRQSNIVDETEWSKAKVSRLLARLDENGDVTKIRLGRENVICLPGQEPEGSKPRTER